MFETVHTCGDWFDGPRSGIADDQGHPHFSECEWYEAEDRYADTFDLSPVDEDTFRLAVEDWGIWRHWETAFHQGLTFIETIPALPEERARHEELCQLLKERLVIDPVHRLVKRANFHKGQDPAWNGLGKPPLQVRWYD